jgi:hypothetical protein
MRDSDVIKVWVTSTAPPGARFDHGRGVEPLLALAAANLAGPRNTRYAPADRPEDADLIVFVEVEYVKFRSYLRTLEAQPLLRRFPNRCFVIDCADTVLGLVPGVYTCLRTDQEDRARFRSGGYLRTYNPFCEEVFRATSGADPRWLFSFRGADSSCALRRRLLATRFPGDDNFITEQRNWCDHPADIQKRYAEEIAASRFVLCPRGVAPASIRLFETLQLGRVPVILADEWVPPEGPSWPEISLRVSESRIDELAEIIRANADRAEVMGRSARRAWEEWFAPDVIFLRMLDAIEGIRLQRPLDHNEARYQRAWHSLSFRWARGWTVPQRLVSVAGRAAARVRGPR